MTPRLLGFLRKRKNKMENDGSSKPIPVPYHRLGREDCRRENPQIDQQLPLPQPQPQPPPSSSPSYCTAPSASCGSSSPSCTSPSPAVMVCNICEIKRCNARCCFLNMLGCSHVLCVDCFLSVQSTVENADEEGVRPCPITDCAEGFFLSDPIATAAAAAAAFPEEEANDRSNDFYCNICMESKSPEEGFMDIKGCTHVFCSDCIAKYVAAKVDENAVSIACPDTSCFDGILEMEACRPILDPQVYLRWGAALCESSIEGTMKVYCPYNDCSALLLNDEEITNTKCPYCQRMLCAKCKVPWHKDFTCEAFQELGDGERAKEDLMLMKMAEKSRWQRCPNCGFFVERVNGCVFIRCRCQHCFCYVCAAAMDANDAKHYCSKCHITWGEDSKPRAR